MSVARTTYRADIDGLRAVAVAAVVLYHAGLAFPGGFVGVDVFFVISGFLITGILQRELFERPHPLSTFWERRIRRILPAATATLLVTLAGSYLVMMSSDFRLVAQSAAAQGLFGSNFFFAQTNNYFLESSEAVALLHTWSLAVEEQFYLVLPLVLLWFRKTARSDSRWPLLILGTLCLLSFALSVVGMRFRPQETFYLLPTRAWELLLGVVLALAKVRVQSTAVREVLAWLGLALIAAAALVYTKDTPFPGAAASVPCVGAALVIGTGGTPTSLARLLSWQPLVFIGLISYSLYLIHWPLLILTQYWFGPFHDVVTPLAVVALAVGLATLSWRWIERPVREKRVLKSQRSIWIFATVSIVIVVASGLLSSNYLPARFATAQAKFTGDGGERLEGFSGDVGPEALDRDRGWDFGAKNRPGVDILIWGDSHARALLPALQQYADAHGLSGHSATFSSTPPLWGYIPPRSSSLGDRTPEWCEAVLRYIKRHHVRDVVLVGRWDGPERRLGEAGFRDAVLTTAKKLRATGAEVWLMLEVPLYEQSVPQRLVIDAVNGRDSASWAQTPETYATFHQPSLDLIGDTGAPLILDPRPLLLGSDHRFRLTFEGKSLYRDTQHLTIAASRGLLGAMFEEQFHPSQVPSQ